MICNQCDDVGFVVHNQHALLETSVPRHGLKRGSQATGASTEELSQYRDETDSRLRLRFRPLNRTAGCPETCYAGSFTIFPMNMIVPENRSRMTNRNGRSTRIAEGADVRPIPTLVAAAASVPSSLTSTNVCCMTLVITCSIPRGDMGLKYSSSRVT